jgi:TonB family protein
LQPWHLKASYDLFDDDGKPLAKGLFEEWWVAKDKWKQSYTGDHYTGTTYRSPEGFASEGERPAWPEVFIAGALVSPIQEDFPKDFRPTPPTTLAHPKPPLSCMNISPVNAGPRMALSPYTYCFDAGTAILRLRGDSYALANYSRVELFQGKEVGADTSIKVNGQVLVKVHLEDLTSDPGMTDEVFAPKEPLSFVHYGKDALPVTPPKLVHSTDPALPLGLDRQHVEGKVVVRFTVGKDGKVTGLHVLESPNWPMAESVLNAVRTYRFEPAQQNGQPVATEVNIVVDFKVFRHSWP